MGKNYPPYFREARKRFKNFPSKQRKTVAEKQAESVPLERAERRALQLDSLCRTADRLLIYSNPVNGASKASLQPSERKPKPERSVLVYLLRFSSKISDEPPFLKIGITNEMAERFGFDVYRYSREEINSIGGLTRKEALTIERSLHIWFCAKSYTPKLRLLSGGNTECFVDDAEIVTTVANLFRLIYEERERAGVAQLAEHSPRK